MSKQDRIKQQLEEAQARWQRLGVRLGKITLAREQETRIEERLRLDTLIAEVEASRSAVASQLDLLEEQLQTWPALPLSACPLAEPVCFWSYAPAEQALLRSLQERLRKLPGGSLITHFDRGSSPLGEQPTRRAAQELMGARLILLLLSADYLADDQLLNTEAGIALHRHQTDDALVIPILARSCLWQETPLAALQHLPRDGTPIAGRPDRGVVLEQVAAEIHDAALRVRPHSA